MDPLGPIGPMGVSSFEPNEDTEALAVSSMAAAKAAESDEDKTGEVAVATEVVSEDAKKDDAAEAKENTIEVTYLLNTREDLIRFLEEADIKLVRSEYLMQWHKEGIRLPRRQEAEKNWPGCLVQHDEMRSRIEIVNAGLDFIGGSQAGPA